MNFLWQTNNNVADIKAVNGFIDLSNENVMQDIIPLDGTWQIEYSKVDGKVPSDKYIEVPGTWKEHTHGNATYTLHVKLPEKGLYGLYIGMICNAYRLQINGEEVLQNGVVGENIHEEKASWKYQIVPFYTELEVVEIKIEVSNHHLISGGIADNIFIGSIQELQGKLIGNQITTTITMGIFLGLSCYMLLLYSMKEKHYAYLFLSLQCIAQVALMLIVNECIIYYIIPGISFEIVYKLQFLAYMGDVMALNAFINAMYPRQKNKKYFVVIMSFNLLYTLLVLFLPVRLVTYIANLYIIILGINMTNIIIHLIQAIYKKESCAKLILTGIVMVIFTTFIDVIKRSYGLNAYSGIRNMIYGQLFLLICQMYLVYREVEYAFEQSAEAKTMEIAFLQAQIAPHFFFNTLNNIYNMMEVSVTKAQGLILDFCDFLRVKHKFDYRKYPMYSLKEELELLQAYVRIENMRLNEQLELKINVEETLLKVMIPQLIIQPLVENAIKHGFKGTRLIININCTQVADELNICVTDNGKGMGANIIAQLLNTQAPGEGIGIKNVIYRLDKYYGKKMTIESEEGKGTSIVIKIPLEG